jgi:uncharacterized alpha-E superfamily protein
MSVEVPRSRRAARPLPDRALLALLLSDANNPSSLLSSIGAARENARTTRDILPTEAWRAVNELHMYSAERLPRVLGQRHRDAVLGDIVAQCQQIAGLLQGTMSHGPAYQFVRIGRFIERADMTTRIVDVAAALLLTGKEELAEFDTTLWAAVLRSLSGYQMYRQYVRRRVESADVLRYLLKDREFPRAIRYCSDELGSAFARLPHPDAAVRAAAKLGAEVDRVRPGRMSIDEVRELVDQLQAQLAGLNDVVTTTWFRPLKAA